MLHYRLNLLLPKGQRCLYSSLCFSLPFFTLNSCDCPDVRDSLNCQLNKHLVKICFLVLFLQLMPQFKFQMFTLEEVSNAFPSIESIPRIILNWANTAPGEKLMYKEEEYFFTMKNRNNNLSIKHGFNKGL